MAEKVSPIAIAQIGQWAENVYFGIGQSVPCSLCGFALGIGVIGALLHIEMCIRDRVYAPSAGVSAACSVLGSALRTLTIWSYHLPLVPSNASWKSVSSASTGMSRCV